MGTSFICNDKIGELLRGVRPGECLTIGVGGSMLEGAELGVASPLAAPLSAW